MRKLNTIGSYFLAVSSNKRERTFRIKTNSGTYKTTQLTRDEFDDAENWTGNDWQNYLRTEQYTKIK